MIGTNPPFPNPHSSSSRSLATTSGLTAAALAGLAAYAIVAPRSQLCGPVLTAPARPGELALTFDDGPNPALTPALLDLLAQHNVRATFFLIGQWALREPALVRRTLAAGHALGCHTLTHPRLPLCSHPRIRRELQQGKAALERITGTPVRLFRPPHGYRTPFVLRTARALGMHPTTWTTIGNDWSLPTAEAIADRVEAGIHRSWLQGRASNVVLHDGSQSTPTADRSRTLAATALLLSRLPATTRFVPLTSWL